jgi:streptogramin lyase
VANSESDSVTRIDPESGEVVGRPLPAGRGPTSVAFGAGAVWVTNPAANRVTRVDP